MNSLSFYREHSYISSPGMYQDLYTNCPTSIPELCNMVQGLIFHYAEGQLYHYQIPEHRFNECHLRTAENILERLMEIKKGPLYQERDYQQRVVGVCRDNALLMCSIIRQQQIPARVRVGFVNYIFPGLYVDGMCVEYWNSVKNKWCYVDARTNQDHIRSLKLDIDFDLMDLPEGKYYTAAEAWYLCRNSILKASRFGYGLYRGFWVIRNRMLQDLACLNKDEVLLWDYWGLMSGYNKNYKKMSDLQLEQLDEISNILRACDRSENINDLLGLAEEYL